ncbi:MAG TPA: hypothetical protein VN756_12450 [Solirubrobacterales bacterium]|nr:hypothetical protein [Solirubrobacterales bacterium]
MNLKRPNLKEAGLGSKLKASELKAPEFLADFYYDLRDRRLLPIIALVVVAIAAVPFLLGDDGEGPQLPAPTPEVGISGATAADSARLTVVESSPGLRNYRKRLRGSPTDPFVQRYTGVPSTSKLQSVGGEAEVEGGSGGGSDTAAGGESAATPEAPSGAGEDNGSSPGRSEGTPSGSSGGGENDPSPRLLEFIVDVQIVHSVPTPDEGQEMGEPQVRRRVRALTQLPGAKAPVVTTGGVNLRNGKVVFLVSNEVKSLDGDFTCLARTPAGVCELLEIERGFPFELVYGPNRVLYRLKVTKIDAVWAGWVGDKRSPRANLVGPAWRGVVR